MDNLEELIEQYEEETHQEFHGFILEALKSKFHVSVYGFVEWLASKPSREKWVEYRDYEKEVSARLELENELQKLKAENEELDNQVWYYRHIAEFGF